MLSAIARRLSQPVRAVRIARARTGDFLRHRAARLYRASLLGTTFIAVTGSAGKTTAKRLTARILSAHASCRSSPGTANEHCHVEWAVLGTRHRHRFCVIEAGAPEPGYLDRSLRVIRPHISVLTRIALEHYAAYRSAEAIAQEKAKIVLALPEDGVAVLNRDDPLVREIGERRRGRTIWFGEDADSTIRLLQARSEWPGSLVLKIRYEGQDREVCTRLHGVHQAASVLASLGAALAAGVPFSSAIETVSQIEAMQGRMQVEAYDGIVFVRDDLKSPQWSLNAPLEFLRRAHARRKLVVLGTISDSPNSPDRRYARAARQALEVADLVVLVGVRTPTAADSRAALANGTLRTFATLRDASGYLKAELRKDDMVLLKGTNRHDHLVRLILDRQEPVACWSDDCRLHDFCGSCPHLRSPAIGTT